MKRVYKESLPRWALLQRESWYRHMAAQGLRVQKAGPALTRFERAEPADVRYRLEPGDQENGGDISPAQKAFYAECGWQWVLQDGRLHLFCAEGSAPELHTDPAWQAQGLGTLRSSIYGEAALVLVWAVLLLLNLTSFGKYTIPLLRAEGIGFLLVMLGAVVLYRLGWSLYSLVCLVKNRRRLKAGKALAHDTPYKPLRLAHRVLGAALLCIYAVCLGLFAWEIGTCQDIPLPDVPPAPLLTLEQLEDETYRRADAANSNGDNWLETVQSPYALRLNSQESGQMDVYGSTYLHQRYYRLHSPQDAKAVGRAALARLWPADTAAYTTLYETGDTLALRLAGSEAGHNATVLLLVDGPHVFYVHYWGGGADSDTVTRAAQTALAALTE